MRLGGGNNLTLRTYHPAVTAIVMPVAVRSHAVTANDISLIFNRARGQ